MMEAATRLEIPAASRRARNRAANRRTPGNRGRDPELVFEEIFAIEVVASEMSPSAFL